MKMTKTQFYGMIQEAVKANGGNQRAQNSVVETIKRKLNEDIDITSMPSGTRLAYKSLLQWVRDTNDEGTKKLFNMLIQMIESDYNKPIETFDYNS